MNIGRSFGGTNLEHARFHNRRAVLDVVRRAGTIPRSEIARETGLTLQTISNIVEDLASEGLLLVGNPVRGGRGQPYSINPQGGWTVGVHVSRHRTSIVLMDFSGKVVVAEDVPLDPKTPQETLPILKEAVDRFSRDHGLPMARLLGTGLALPTRFGLGAISVAGPTGFPGWGDAAAREAFVEALPFPIIIENDAVAAAIGEKLAGAARTLTDFVQLYLDDGLGAGLFLNGQPHRGVRLGSGEVGHIALVPNGRPCPCGNTGCAERYLSLRAAYEALTENPSEAEPAMIDRVMAETPERLSGWLDEAGGVLRLLVNILESTLDSETIILSGTVSTQLLERLIDAARPFAYSASAASLNGLDRLMPGELGPFAAAVGAASLPIYEEFNPRFDVLMKE
jgi:predicted NBD/HSP70 family sugar kinase